VTPHASYSPGPHPARMADTNRILRHPTDTPYKRQDKYFNYFKLL
jgi:hypothetical protein